MTYFHIFKKLFNSLIMVFSSGFLFISGCDSGSVDANILVYDLKSDSYKFDVVQIDTINDLDKLEGEVTSLMGGTAMTLNYVDLYISWQRVGRPVAFGYSKSDSVIYPEDFNSLAMISTYYNIENTTLFFENIGMKQGLIGHLETYYQPEIIEVYLNPITQKIEKSKGVDNAFYLSISKEDRAFYVLPFRDIKTLPLSMNLGVITHEYTHSVFDILVYDKMDSNVVGTSDSSVNYLSALNEGFADIMAVANTGDPDYMTHSLADTSGARDASDLILYKKSFDMNAMFNTGIYFDPYEIGSFVSSIFYGLEMKIDNINEGSNQVPSKNTREIVAGEVYKTIVALGKTNPVYFKISAFFNLFIDTVNPQYKTYFCNILRERYDEDKFDTEIEGC
ncbi:MAG: hypothetical protein JXR91_11635 [Deltaproteobacteria bacterium]|nr:hypothetical protein [Deltaproteobacteria bacterium]